MKKRIIFFGNGTSPYTATIFRGFLEGFQANDFELILNVDTVPYSEKVSSTLQTLNKGLKKIFSPGEYIDNLQDHDPFYSYTPTVPLKRTININEPVFLEYLSSLSPDYAILVGCPQIARKEFLSCFQTVVNGHASLLPYYRGLYPVNWAMFNSEKSAGFTFHYVNEKIDDGNIITQKEVPIDYTKHPSEVMRKISQAAADSAKIVIQQLKKNYEGMPQNGAGSYYGKTAVDKLLTIYRLSDHLEVRKKINCFGYVKARYKGSWVYVTRIDHRGKIQRIQHLPPGLYACSEIARKMIDVKTTVNSTVQYFQKS